MNWKRFSIGVLTFALVLFHINLPSSAYNNPSKSDSTPTGADSASPAVAQNYPHKIFFPYMSTALNARYISLDGFDPSDCSGGTVGRPWKSWAKAEACAFPNMTVYFKAGTYAGVFSGPSRNKITFKGLPGQPVRIRPAPGHGGRVHFRQTLNIRGEHGVISGIDIDADSIYSAISVYQAQDVRFEYNKIHGSSKYDCVHIHRDSDGISLVNNEIYDCGYNNGSYSGPGDAVDTTGGTNVLFRGNHVHHAMRGFQIKGGSRDVLVEKNHIHHVEGVFNGVMMGSLSGDQPQHGNSSMHDPAIPIEERYQVKNVMIRNNLIHNVDGFFVMSFGGWVDYQIYNNVFFNHSGSWVFDVQLGTWEFFDSTALAYCETHSCAECTSYSGSEPCVKVPLPSKNGAIRNNIFHTFAKILRVRAGNDTHLGIDHNLYHADDFSQHTPNVYELDGTRYTLEELQALGYEADSLIADPQFVDINDVSHPDLRLQPTSPAINRGRTLSEVRQDCEGVPRPQGPSHDIGAYEQVVRGQ